MKIIMAAVCAAVLAGCGGEPISVSESSYTLPPIEWRILSQGELERAYVEHGMPFKPGDKLTGFATRDGRGNHVVYTLRPRHVDDQATLALGHEIIHTLEGAYHR